MGEGKRKILAIDVGNTNIVVGLFEGERLRWHRRFETHKGLSLLRKLWISQVNCVVVASVVPRLDKPFRLLLRKKFGVEPLFVTSRTKLPIRFKTKKPSEVGADRIANAVAAWKIPPTPLCPSTGLRTSQRGARGDLKTVPIIIIDFGTATTLDVVSAQGEYLGGPIVPGLRICLEALHEKTARLPLVSIAKPKRVIGRQTRECIQGGVYYGYAGLVDRLVGLIQKELGMKTAVIATGGFATLIAKECRTIQKLEPFLTLKGLRIVADKKFRAI